MHLFVVFSSLKNLLLVCLLKLQGAQERGDGGHKMSFELRCAGPASSQTTEGPSDDE